MAIKHGNNNSNLGKIIAFYILGYSQSQQYFEMAKCKYTYTLSDYMLKNG